LSGSFTSIGHSSSKTAEGTCEKHIALDSGDVVVQAAGPEKIRIRGSC